MTDRASGNGARKNAAAPGSEASVLPEASQIIKNSLQGQSILGEDPGSGGLIVFLQIALPPFVPGGLDYMRALHKWMHALAPAIAAGSVNLEHSPTAVNVAVDSFRTSLAWLEELTELMGADKLALEFPNSDIPRLLKNAREQLRDGLTTLEGEPSLELELQEAQPPAPAAAGTSRLAHLVANARQILDTGALAYLVNDAPPPAVGAVKQDLEAIGQRLAAAATILELEPGAGDVALLEAARSTLDNLYRQWTLLEKGPSAIVARAIPLSIESLTDDLEQLALSIARAAAGDPPAEVSGRRCPCGQMSVNDCAGECGNAGRARVFLLGLDGKPITSRGRQ